MRRAAHRASGRGRGATMVELLVALVILSVILLGILPVLDLAVHSDRSAENTTEASSVATRVIETLKLYRAIQNTGAAIPAEFAGFALTAGDPVEVTAEGIWGSLGIDPARFDITYTLVADVDTGKIQARVDVRTSDPLAGKGGGGVKWVQFTSLIE